MRKYLSEYEECIVGNEERNNLVAGLAQLAYQRGYYTIILVQRIAHLKMLSKKLLTVPHRIVYGEEGVSDRIVAKQKFERGDIRLIIANQVFKKGIDIRRVDVIIDAAGLKSPDDALQKFGRGIRLHNEKKGLLFFDIADIDPENQDNRFQKAAKRRKRAYTQAGIKVKDVTWDGSLTRLFDIAEKTLAKEN